MNSAIPEKSAEPDDSIPIKMMTVTSSRMIQKDVNCSVSVSYPLIDPIRPSSPSEEVIKRIAKRIDRELFDVFLYYIKTPGILNLKDEGIKAANLSEAIWKYNETCEQELRRLLAYYKDTSRVVMIRGQTIESKIILNEKGLLSMNIGLQDEFGGAHPIYHSAALTFDVKTGDELTLDELIREDELENFYRFEKRTLVDYSRRIYGDSIRRFPQVEEALVKNGALPEEMRMKLFYLAPEGMFSIYQDYEITSHGEGPPSVLMNYEDLKPFMRMDGPLARFLK